MKNFICFLLLFQLEDDKNSLWRETFRNFEDIKANGLHLLWVLFHSFFFVFFSICISKLSLSLQSFHGCRAATTNFDCASDRNIAGYCSYSCTFTQLQFYVFRIDVYFVVINVIINN